MTRSWTFARQVTAGFLVSLAFLVLVGGVSYRSNVVLIANDEQLTRSYAVLNATAEVLSIMKDAETGQRGFVITGDDSFLAPHTKALAHVDGATAALAALVQGSPRHQERLARARRAMDEKLAELKRTIEMRPGAGLAATAEVVRGGVGKRLMDQLREALGEIDQEERELLAVRARQATETAHMTGVIIIGGTLIAFFVVTLCAVLIIRALDRRLGAAIQHLQSSTAELQATAGQQATSTKEQSTAMTEITTTIKELMATSQQIAESAQRVVHVAERTAGAARSGDQTVQRSQESVAAIQRQVDLVVGYMLDLGKKSQQIGAILEIINELAEQTNILAINATIEAAGAGESGRRFAVVADEIRKLADRVGGSTKEIRSLIEEIRSSVNTTVMATETSAKTVDAATRQFGDVKDSLRQIVTVVETTTEAAREIELSTKQQATAVAQVNIGIADVAQAAREMEGGANQTLQTATQLATLARELSRIVQAPAST